MAAGRRPRGTGSLLIYRDSRGGEAWYGSFYVGGRRVKRKIGEKRQAGTRRGLTKTQAEAALRRMAEEVEPPAAVVERLTIEQAGARYRASSRPRVASARPCRTTAPLSVSTSPLSSQRSLSRRSARATYATSWR